ncbi:hypothetical protein DVK44_19260 [Streptomyces paludis]|uniref:Uncharacterized protein n=1 Tax=Streptomyces paludis TaxID=2282738 RepID=A0A345HRW2_9ACTN|nr:hypothetical protein DVK44_19260 [Streptomyces paludis]
MPDAAPGPSASGRAPRFRRGWGRGFLMAAVACGAVVALGVGAVLVLLDGQLPGGPGGTSVAADEPYYHTTAELEASADLVVRAKLGTGRTENRDGVTNMVAPAKIIATAKGGAVPGSSIEVAYTPPGTSSEAADLVPGKEYVLLLSGGGDGRYYLVNTTQGWYEVDGDGRMTDREIFPDVGPVGLSAGVRRGLGLVG